MKTVAQKLPDDVDSLKDLVLELRTESGQQQTQISDQQSKIEHQANYINQLIEGIKLARDQRFGSSSEKHDKQLSLLFNEAEATVEAESTEQPTNKQSPKPRNKGGRRSLPDHLPRARVVHQLDDEACEVCGDTRQVIGQSASEQIDIIPACVQVLRHVRMTYRCGCGITKALMPTQPIRGSIASAGTVAHVVVDKYVNHMPLYRQEQQFNRLQIPLNRATLANWVVKSSQLIQPLINLMRDKLLSYDIIQMDETTLQVLKEPGRKAKSKSYMWIQRGGPTDQVILLYDYAPSRSGEVPKDLLDDYGGFLQTDGYGGYNSVCKKNNITQLGCMAHARRKFDQALKIQGHVGGPTLADYAMGMIQKLYAIEKSCKDMQPAERLAIRQVRSTPILNQLKGWLDQNLPRVVKGSALGKAMGYFHNHFTKLSVYTTDGRLNIDNNLCENAIRPFVIGRKNYLFCDTVTGAKASANLYSLIETAKANGIEPYGYLKKVFTELPNAKTVEAIEALLPFKPQLVV